MIPLLLAGLMAVVGYTIGRQTKTGVVSGAESGFVWNPAGYWERRTNQVPSSQQTVSAVQILMKLVTQRLPVSPGLAQAAYQEAIQMGDMTTAQQIAVVFLQPPPQQVFQPPPPIMVGEEEREALEQTYGDAEPVKAVSTTVHHSQPPQPSISDVSPEEWKEFLLCFKTKDPSYKGERHFGAFEHSTRRVSQLGWDPSALTTEESQLAALDSDLKGYLQSNEKLLNDFTGDSVDVNGQKICVTRSGVLALLKAAGPAGAKGWLTEPHQRKAFPHTTEIFVRGNGRF
jgi:hypothetical protein